MDWFFADFLESLGEQAEGIFDSFTRDGSEAGLSSLIAPVDPFNRSALLTPLVTVVGVATALLLSGVAVGAMVALLAALLALYFLLTEVFGYEVSVAAPIKPAR